MVQSERQRDKMMKLKQLQISHSHRRPVYKSSQISYLSPGQKNCGWIDVDDFVYVLLVHL